MTDIERNEKGHATKQNYAEWKDKFATAKNLRMPALNAISKEWMSQTDISNAIKVPTSKLSEIMAWIRMTQGVTIEVWERINKPTLYRRKA